VGKREPRRMRATKWKIYKIIAWVGAKDWPYCLKCGDRDELYQPLYRNDFFPGEIIRCLRCGRVIRGEVIAGLIDNKLVLCLECTSAEVYEALAEQDFSPDEKIICDRCGKTIKE
jgi:hypothetical protein